MVLCACRGSSQAVSPKRAGDGASAAATERLRLQLHSAMLDRSFTTVGWMDPYAVVSVDGRVIHQTPAASWSHKSPSWDAVCTVRADRMPSSVTVTVFTANRWKKDVVCGSVTVPCTEDMDALQGKEFALTKRSEPTGTLRLSMTALGVVPGILRSISNRSQPSALGAEMDHIANFLDEASPVGAKSARSGGSSGRSLVLAEPGENIVSLDYGDETPAHPTLLSPKRGRGLPFADSVKKAPSRQSSALSAEPGEADIIDVDALVIPEADPSQVLVALEEADDQGGEPEVLAGSWTCVATNGLDEFLKKTGVNAFQRRLAAAARWPSWDFTLAGDRMKFVNHSALGDLHEEILLDGSSYQWKDGRGNPLTCTAAWTKTAKGGVLSISKSGALGKYTEERRVEGDSLVFVLTNDDGASWGRTFQRSK